MKQMVAPTRVSHCGKHVNDTRELPREEMLPTRAEDDLASRV